MINPNELLFAVDENNQEIEPVERRIAHAQGIWHRTSDILVLNGIKFLCQKRSMLKDNHPGKWQACFGGHLSPTDSYLSGAQKELEEETGIKLPRNRFQYLDTHQITDKNDAKGIDDREFLAVFLVEWAGNIANLQIEASEIDEVAWREAQYILEHLGSSDDWVVHGYEHNLIQEIMSSRR